jgi:predicted amidophosphoribosyltransferase
MPRLIERRTCPHCEARLPEPRPRSCPTCGGSLQKRFLQIGCLSSAPPIIALAWFVRELLLG